METILCVPAGKNPLYRTCGFDSCFAHRSSIFYFPQEEKIKNKCIFQYFGVILFAVLSFFIVFFYGTDDYKSDLIAVKHIDGKYGKVFYGVEVFGKDAGNRIEIYARIYVDGRYLDFFKSYAILTPERRASYG